MDPKTPVLLSYLHVTTGRHGSCTLDEQAEREEKRDVSASFLSFAFFAP